MNTKILPTQRTLRISTFILIFAMLLAACSGVNTLAPAASISLAQPQTQVQAVAAAQTSSGQLQLSSGVLAAYQSALQDVYALVDPSVVSIHVTSVTQTSSSGSQSFPFSLPGLTPNDTTQQYTAGVGSGFVWDKQGHIITNNHVIDGATKIQVVFTDGYTVSAKVVGRDADSDLAVLQVDVSADMLLPVQVADSSQVKVGQVAIAIGNPFDQSNTMTVGIVSAINRTLSADLSESATTTSYSIPDIIQTDAAINPGNSGGVLVDDQGQLIGVTFAIESPVRANSGVGYAIPSALVQRVVPELIKSGKYQHPYLGVTVASLTPDLAQAMNLNSAQRGALVSSVTSGSPADKAGLKGSTKSITIDGTQVNVGGDVIIAIAGQPVKGNDDLIAYLSSHTSVGQQVSLTVLRDGAEKNLSVTLEARPTTTAQSNTTNQTPQQQRPNRSTPQPSNPSTSLWLGIYAQPMTAAIAAEMSLPESQTGILIQQVEAGSPADTAGLRGSFKPVIINRQRILVGGDVITAIDGKSVSTTDDLRSVINSARAGQEISLDILREGKAMQIKVTLLEKP